MFHIVNELFFFFFFPHIGHTNDKEINQCVFCFSKKKKKIIEDLSDSAFIVIFGILCNSYAGDSILLSSEFTEITIFTMGD